MHACRETETVYNRKFKPRAFPIKRLGQMITDEFDRHLSLTLMHSYQPLTLSISSNSDEN